MHRMVVMVNNTVLYLKVVKRVNFKYSYYTKKKWLSCEMMEVLANTMVLIIMRHLNISNHHIIHLKFAHCYMSIISQQS